jgi:hypothetical protein
VSERTDRLVERLLEEPPGQRREQMLAQLDADQRQHLRGLLEAGDLVWAAAHTAPLLEEDPVAAMLGVVPDPSFHLDGAALVRACKVTRVKPTALAARLSARGWKVEASDVFRWQTRAASDVPPALIHAIADEVGVEPDRLAARSDQQPIKLNRVAEAARATPRFRALVQRFATVQRLPEAMAASALHSRMLATVNRGDVPDQEQMLASLEALVRALEADPGQ